MSQHSHNDQTSIPGPRANQSCRAFALRALLAFAVATPATSAFAVDFPQPGPNPLSAVNGVLTDSGEAVLLTDAAFRSAKTVAVQPVIMGGGGAWFAMASRLVQATAQPADVVATGQTLSELARSAPARSRPAARAGFGFAGAASSSDRAMLRAALHMGALQSARGLGDVCATKRLYAATFTERERFAALRPAVQRLVQAALRSGSLPNGQPGAPAMNATLHATMTIAELVAAATLGTAGKDARAHGYLAAGVWAGGALLVATLGGDTQYAMMAEPLALQLDKDATFGGADRAVAKVVRGIATELRQRKPNADRIRGLVQQLVELSYS